MFSTQQNRKALYYIGIAVGIGIAVYLYVLNFDNFSETALVGLAGTWIYPMAFGIYGFIGERLYTVGEQQGEAARKTELNNIFGLTMGLGIVFLFPFFFFKDEKPLFMAFVGALGWVVILEVFFLVIFPAL